MKIALTGTPGTGKTSVSKELNNMNYDVLHLSTIIDEAVVGYDDERDCKIIDEGILDKYLLTITEKDILIVEGHLSHLLSVDGVIILRCHPKELQKRLSKKQWHNRKIKENLEAEALDIILDKTLQKHHKVWEIDTTGKTKTQIIQEINNILQTFPQSRYGAICWNDWLVEYVR
jgi:adenylate kinase